MKTRPIPITCPTCSTENDEYAVVCTKCKGFLQNRVPNLDFFPTIWGILQSPRQTFRRIRLAEHKNFVLPLNALFGIALTFTVLWYLKAGERFDSLMDLVIWGTLIGTGAGLALSLVLTVLYHVAARGFSGKSGFRDSLAVLAYAVVPVALSLFLVLPLELMTFGMYLFTSNPHPYAVQPVSYIVLVAADGILAVWSIVLAVYGTRIVHGIGIWKSSAAVLLTLFIAGSAFFLATAGMDSTAVIPRLF